MTHGKKENDMDSPEQGLDIGTEGGSNDPFAGVEADPLGAPAEGSLGGDGETLEDLADGGAPINGGEEPAPGEFLEEPEEGDGVISEEEASEAAAEEARAEAATAEPEPDPAPPAAEPEPEPEPEPQAAEGAKPDGDAEPDKPKAKAAGTAERQYTVLKSVAVGDDIHWIEAVKGGVRAANGEQAIREAYALLVPADSEEEIELSVIPAHYWKPRKVAAKAKVRRTVSID